MEKEELRELAGRDPEAAFREALNAIHSEDRNMRVFALRVIGREGLPGGSAAVLTGLSDQKRRVRKVACQASRTYLDDPAVVHRLMELIEQGDPVSGDALLALGRRYFAVEFEQDRIKQASAGPTPRPALDALASLSAHERYRKAILQSLVMMDLTDDVAALLRTFVETGTKDEAVAATRALCGYRLVTWENVTPPELAGAGAQPGGRAHMYWIRRDAAGPSW